MNFKTRAEWIMYDALLEIAKNIPEECPLCDDMISEAKEALKKVDELEET